MMCIDLKDIKNLTFMVCNFVFVVALFALELPTLLFCVTLLFAEHTKRILSLTITIQEFVGYLAFPSELRRLSSKCFRFFMVLRSALLTKNYCNGLFKGFWILIMHCLVIARIGDAIDKTNY